MVSFRELIISFILVALFSISIIAFGVNLASEHSANTTITDNPEILSVYNSLNESIGTSKTTTSGAMNASESDLPEIGDSLVITSIWTSVLNFGGVIKAVGNTVLRLPYSIGVPPIALTAIITILGITIILLGWKAIRSGE